jgi:hypothetical protein
MFQIQAPILIVPTADAKLALGIHLRAAGLAAYREIALAAKGLEIAHLQFLFRGLTLAGAERRRASRPAGAPALSSSQRRRVAPLLVLAHAVRLHFRGCMLMVDSRIAAPAACRPMRGLRC